MADLNLFVDIQNKVFVTSLTSQTPYSVPALFNTNLQTVSVTMVTPTGNPVAPYSVVTPTGYTLDIVIGPAPSGSSPPALLAYIDGISPSGNTFSGSLTLNTTAVNAFIGAAASASAFLELTRIDSSANRTTIYQGTVVLKAACDTTSATVPSPAASYLTANQSNAAFARLFGLPGQTITLVSPGNHYARILGIDDQGNRIDNTQFIG